MKYRNEMKLARGQNKNKCSATAGSFKAEYLKIASKKEASTQPANTLKYLCYLNQFTFHTRVYTHAEYGYIISP